MQCCRLGTPFPIYSGRNDAACITGSFAAGEEAAKADVLQGVAVAYNAYGGRCTGFDGYHYGFVGQEAAGVAAKLLEAFG